MAKDKNEPIYGPMDLTPIEDIRTPEQKLGNIVNTRTRKAQQTVSVTIGENTQMVGTDKTALTTAEKAAIAQSKRILSEYSVQNIVAIVTLAELAETKGELKTAFEMRKWMAEQVIGKANNAKADTTGMQYPQIKVDFTNDPDAEDEIIIEGDFGDVEQ